MSVFAQMGPQCGSKTTDGINNGFIDGCILSPRDSKLEALRNRIDELKEIDSKFEILFDPQFYASTIAATESKTKLGYLETEYSDFFAGTHYRELRRDSAIKSRIERCLDFQKGLGISKYILPNICIINDFDSASANIALSFLDIGSDVAKSYNIHKQSYLTLAIDNTCIRQTERFLDFMDDLTAGKYSPKQFYILVQTSKHNEACPWNNPEALANQMYLAYVMAENGYKTLWGYSFLSAPFLWAAGADDCAFGWFNTLRYFSLNRFRDLGMSGRRANKRYFSTRLGVPVEWTLVANAMQTGSGVKLHNGFASDKIFFNSSGEEPTDANEILQYWDSLKHIDNKIKSIKKITERIEFLKSYLDSINFTLAKKEYNTFSTAEYRQTADGLAALRTFAKLAEIPFPE